MKADPDLAGMEAADLLDYLRDWHRSAPEQFREMGWDDVRGLFVDAWRSVRFAEGDNPAVRAWELSRQQEYPPVALRYESERYRDLVAWLAELQRMHGSTPFFLTFKQIGDALGIHRYRARAMMRTLESDGVLKTVEKGKQWTPGERPRATRYLFTANMR
jgi:hypothetical protein